MKIVGVDLHAKQQSIATLDTETGEFTENIIRHEGNAVGEFYAALEGRVVVGVEATGSMQWFLELLDELGIQYRVGHPAKIRAAEPRKQKHDRRDARLILELLTANRFPDIWMPSTEQRPANPAAGTNMGFAFAMLGERDTVKRGGDEFMQRQTLDDSNEGGDIIGKSLQHGVFPSGGHRTGS
jgi:Transposase